MKSPFFQTRRLSLSYIYSFRFTTLAFMLHVIFVSILIVWFLFQIKRKNEKPQKSTRKQKILIWLTAIFPLFYLLLCWLNKDQPLYFEKANSSSPFLGKRNILFFVVLIVFAVFSFLIMGWMMAESSVITSLKANEKLSLVFVLIWSFLFAFNFLNVFNIFHVEGFDIFYFFYGIRSSKFSEKQIKEKISWYLCGDINRQFFDSQKIEEGDATAFLRQWNVTFKNKLTPEKFNKMVGNKKCPYGSPRDGKPLPKMDTKIR